MVPLLGFVALCGLVVGFLTTIHPSGFVKTRGQGALLLVGSLALLSIAGNIKDSATPQLNVPGPAPALRPAIERVGDGVAASAGELVEVPSDFKAKYRIVELAKNRKGNADVMTRRDGPSGTSFARRECECPFGRFRYIGEGDTIEAARKPRSPPDKMADLVSDGKGVGSVSYHVCAVACTRATSKAEHFTIPSFSDDEKHEIKSRALIYCSRYAKAASRHPSTIDFSGWGSKVEMHNDGSATVTAPFSAKNSFGLELKHRITCEVARNGDVSGTIVESN